MSDQQQTSAATRRDFMKTAVVAGGALAGGLALERAVHAEGDGILKVALIGCGGRGTSAAVNALRADPKSALTVLADIFPDRIQQCRQILAGQEVSNRIVVGDDQCFSGFDAYKSVMQTDVDVVLLCTTPHFRPAHLRAAIEAGKHVFCEKPVAVDGPGVRHVLETVEMARQKNLTIVSGLCWRYDYGVLETMKRIHDGAIGDILTVQENYLTNPLWHRGRKPEWSEMEYQIRNWLYFTWLSGDHIVEQHVHSLDKALWLHKDQPPMRCYGLGGRQQRTEPKYGNAYDHFAVCYEWADGSKAFAYTRQMKDCFTDVDDYVVGTSGTAQILANTIKPTSGDAWKYPKKPDGPDMYDLEHIALFNGIRSGNVLNNGTYMSFSTLMAIMGREACYTGQVITWDEALNSKTDLSPKAYEWGDAPASVIAVPGETKFV